MEDTLVVIPEARNLAKAEAEAIQALTAWLSEDDGRAAGDEEIQLWLIDRGWPPKLWRKWAERISAAMALADPKESDPSILSSRLNQRFERLAFIAEDHNDLKHAIQASESQAKLNNLGGFKPASSQTLLNLSVTNATAHLVSDDQLIRIARAGQDDAQAVTAHVHVHNHNQTTAPSGQDPLLD